MPVTTIVILIALAVGLVEALVRKRGRGSGWVAFSSWGVAGFLSALATVSVAIGLLELPLALLAIVGAARLAVWPAGLGFVSGAGLIGVLVSALNVGEASSPDFHGWLVAGLIITAASAAAFTVVRSTERSRRVHG